MTISKLGAHVILESLDALAWAASAPVVKSLDRTGALRAATKARIRVFRKYFPVQDIARRGADVVDEVLTALGNAPATHIEAYNETNQRLGYGLERYVAFTAEAVVRLHQRRPDLTLAAFSFSTGNPEPEDWAYLRRQSYGGATCIALHEYWGNQGLSTWNALRHRRVHASLEGQHPPFLITECGRDTIETGKGGWRADGLTEDAYVAELLAYNAALLEDDYVLGAVPFTSGPTPDWKQFDCDPLAGRLIAHTGTLPDPPKEAPMWYPNAVQRPISTNYDAGRSGQAVRAIVDHIADGAGSPFVWFNTDRGVLGSSAHFWVSKAGAVEQYRPLADTCWASGIVKSPDLTNHFVADTVTAGIDPNNVSISIEHEGKPGDVFPRVQIDASRRLHVWLSQVFNIPLTRERVLGHYQWDSVTRANCPGNTFPWKEILMPDQPAHQFVVGPGVAAKMAEQSDQPTTDEQYIGSLMSVTFGGKGLYWYSKQANRTYFVPAA